MAVVFVEVSGIQHRSPYLPSPPKALTHSFTHCIHSLHSLIPPERRFRARLLPQLRLSNHLPDSREACLRRAETETKPPKTRAIHRQNQDHMASNGFSCGKNKPNGLPAEGKEKEEKKKRLKTQDRQDRWGGVVGMSVSCTHGQNSERRVRRRGCPRLLAAALPPQIREAQGRGHLPGGRPAPPRQEAGGAPRQRPRGYGSQNRQGTAGFSPCFHLGLPLFVFVCWLGGGLKKKEKFGKGGKTKEVTWVTVMAAKARKAT